MQATVESIIRKINTMHAVAIALHRERFKYSNLTDKSYDKALCNQLILDIQAHAGDIYNDRDGEEINIDWNPDEDSSTK